MYTTKKQSLILRICENYFLDKVWGKKKSVMSSKVGKTNLDVGMDLKKEI